MKFNRYLTLNKKFFAVCVVLTVLLSFLAPLRSILMQRIIDSTALDEVSVNIVVALVFCVLVFLTEKTVKRMQAKVVTKANAKLRCDMVNKILQKNMKSFAESNSATYISNLNNDVEIVSTQYFSVILDLVMQVGFLITATTLLIFIDPIIFLVVIAVSVFPIVSPKIFSKKIASSKSKLSEQLAFYNVKIKDYLNGFELIKSFNIEDKILKMNEEETENLSDMDYKSKKTVFGFSAISSLVSNISFLCVIAFSTILIINGRISFGYLVAITQMMNFVIPPIMSLSNGITNINATKEIRKKINNLLTETTDKSQTDKFKFNNKIEFKKVSFAYDSNAKNVLSDIDLSFDKGKKYAIVGGSGSGKSTLVKLLLQYYSDFNGEISIDDKNIKTFNKESFYRDCPVIHQDTFLFNDTIKNNITLYEDFSDTEINLAIEKSGLSQVICSLDDGIEHFLSENGGNLSGGQRQRISIARALIRNPSLLILDESTSSLDKEISYKIEKSILETKDLTAIVITHKLSENILDLYDEIIVLNNGKIVESGNFDELINNKSYFYNLYSL